MNPETGHLYVYCANNPVNYVDPSGHFAAAMYTVIKLVLVGGAVAYVSYSSWKNHSSKTKYAGRKIISKTKVSVWLTAGVVDRIIYSKSKKKSNTKKKKESKKVKKKERQIFQVGHMDLDQKKGKVEMSMQLGKWMNIMEKENGQEKESKERNIVNWESGEIEDDNWYSKNINGGANIFMIYELKFSYYEDNSENNDEIIIAVYSSYKKAEIGKKKFSQQPRFKGKEYF